MRERAGSPLVAEVLAAQVEAGALENPDPGPTPARVAELLEQWLVMKGQSKIRPSTLKTYRYLTVPVRARLGEVPLLAVTSRTVEQYCRTRLRQGIRPASVGDERALIRMAMGWATAQGWWRGDAKGLASDVDLATTGDRRWLEAEQVLPFLDAFDDPSMQMVAALGVFAGLRLNEATHLRWDAVDLRRSCIHVRPVEMREGQVWRPKTRAGTRTVQIPAILVERLRERLDAAKRCALDGGPEPEWVCTTRSGDRRRSPRHVLKALSAACRKAGLPRVTHKELRHSWVTALHDAGTPLSVIAAMAGHESEVTTRQVYRHLTEYQRREAAERLQAFLVPARAATNPATEAANCNDPRSLCAL